MAIFWPTAKCAVDVTGRLVDPAGYSTPCPPGSGCHSVVGVPAGWKPRPNGLRPGAAGSAAGAFTALTVYFSLPRVISSPGLKPSTLRT